MSFFKDGCNGGDRKFLLELRGGGGPRNAGVGFIMGGWGLFKVSLHSWQRVTNPLFYEEKKLPILPTPTF